MLRAVSALISFAVVAAIVYAIGPGELARSLAAVPASAVAGLLGLLLVNLALVLARLHWTLGHVGVPVPWRVSVRASIAGLVSSLFVFNLFGAILGRQYVLRERGVPASAVVLVSGYERFVMALVGVVLAVFGFLVLFGAAATREALGRTPLVQGAVVLPIVLIATALIARPRREIELLRKLLAPAALSRALGVAGLTVAANVTVFVAYALAVRTLADGAGWSSAIAAASIVTLAASLPLSVNGWGIREVASIYAFGALGVPAADAVAASVLVGLCSTAVVALAAPLLLLRREIPPAGPAPAAAMAVSEDGRYFARAAALVLGHLGAFLLFFQVQAAFAGGWITLNFADPVAVLGLCLVAVSFVFARRMPVRLPPAFSAWLAAIAMLLLLAFANGYFQYGLSHWALANRMVGAFVLAGYVACGALVCAELGAHGRRRLAETLVVTAVAVLVVYTFERQLRAFEVLEYQISNNFQGYSGNRNTFAFQVLVCLCLSLAYGELRRRARADNAWTILLGLLMLGLWQIGSIAGLLAGPFVVALAFTLRPALRPAITRAIALACVLAAVVWAVPAYLAPPRSAAVAIEKGAVFDPAEVLAGTSTEGRLRSIETGLALWAANPVFGAGLGAAAETSAQMDGAILVIHSTPVWILAEFGLAGAFAVASLPAYLVWKRRFRPPSGRESAATAVFFLLAFFAIFSLVHDVAYQRIWWLVLALLAGAAIRSPDYKPKLRPGTIEPG